MDLDVYERAYLCGGPDRAARTALLSLHASGSIRVAESHPHKVERVRRGIGYAVELVLLDRLPSSGLPVRLVLRRLAESPAMDRCATELFTKGLLRRSFRRLVRPTRAGVELRERLAEDVGDDELERFGVLGISPRALRLVLAGLPAEAEFPIKLARRRAKPGYDDRGDYSPPFRNAETHPF